MQGEPEMTNLEKDIDNIIIKMILPITDELKLKAKEIKQKRAEVKNEIYNIRQLKQSLNEKKKKLNKQKILYEKQMNGDFSNTKLCQECLTNYINIMDKKQTDFLKDKDDFYELKLRRKQLEFNNLLIDIIKEQTNIEKKKNIKRKMSFDAHGKLNKSSSSIKKDLNKSFKSTDSKGSNKSKNKLKNKIPHKTEIRKCYKFTSNPQRFFTEDLCDTVLKAYDLQPKKKINTHKNNNRKIHSVSPSQRLIYNKKLIEKNKNNEKKNNKIIYYSYFFSSSSSSSSLLSSDLFKFHSNSIFIVSP